MHFFKLRNPDFEFQIFVCSDDHSVLKWNLLSDETTQVQYII